MIPSNTRHPQEEIYLEIRRMFEEKRIFSIGGETEKRILKAVYGQIQGSETIAS